ncbi:MAG: NAD-reducing hydrogenase HoxS subunit beta [Pseudomonadota bacterium]|jgi:NAD-reducing hydrogenase large subunit
MNDLETAAQPEGLRRVAIDPVSRVEGHGKVTILMDEAHRVHQVRLHIVEFRGFEVFIEGRPYWEVPVMVQRLCGICPVSHHLAAVKAMDQIVGADALPPTVDKLRRLMHHGQILQSHALHFFHLCSPDLLLGFDSPPTQRHILGVAAQHPELARQGVWLRKFGQEVIRHTSGKRVHGTGAIPGGMNKRLTPEERGALRADVDQAVAWAQAAVGLFMQMHAAQPAFYDGFGEVAAHMVSLVGPDGALDLYDGRLRATHADGSTVFDQVDVARYLDVMDERTKPWTYMKFPHLRALGPQDGWYRVGPLARMGVASRLATPLAEAERQTFLAAHGGRVPHGVLNHHWARLIELLHAAETIRDLLDDPDITGDDLRADLGPRRHEAVGVIEAPRGTLIHHYRVGDDDLVSHCNLIVSTTHNNQAMNEAIRQVARIHLDGRAPTEALLNHIEVAIRAYDPCLSCATHALGQMPLQVDVVDAAGQTVHQLRSGGA